MTKLSYSCAVHVLGRCPMVNRVAGYQPPTGATPLLRFGLPSLPGVVGMVLAPGTASGNTRPPARGGGGVSLASPGRPTHPHLENFSSLQTKFMKEAGNMILGTQTSFQPVPHT